MRVAFPNLGKTYPVISAGAGVLIWADDEPYESSVGRILELEIGVRIPAFSWAALSVGVKGQSISQGVSGGMRLDAEGSTYIGMVAGLVVPLR